MALTQQQAEAALKKETANNAADRMMREIRASVLFQFKWEDLLTSAPVSISCLGACMVAASSPINVTFEKPKEGFKYLVETGGKYDLRANLVACVDAGRMAFIQAESEMGRINLTSANVYNTVDDIMQSLGSPQDAKILLRRQLESLRAAATDCYESAKTIDEKFDVWLWQACELHLACVATQSSTEDKLAINEIDLAVTKTSIDYQKETVESAKKATQNLEKSLNAATEAYKKASDEFPTGWDILGQQIVGQLADSLTTALNQAIPALVQNLNPIAKVGAITNMASGLLRGDKKEDTPATGQQAPTPTQPHVAANSPSSTRPKDADDPAYSQVSRDLIYWELINADFSTDGGVNWEKARGEAGKPAQSTSFASKMLENSKKSFAAGPGDPSKKYAEALATACKIATGILDELNKAKDIKYTPANKDSDLVKGWQKDFASAYATAVELNATGKNLPGSTTGVVTGGGVDPAVQTAQIQAKTTQAQAVLESAKNRLNTTASALASSQENYQKSTALLVEQQNKLMELNGAFERLKASGLTMEGVKAILVQCIALVVKLKNEITNLVRFFKSIAVIVKFVQDKHVEPYISTIKAIASGGSDDVDFKIGSFTLTDLQRSNCFNSTIMIRSYFSIFGDIATMWAQLSQECVFPGIRMIDEITGIDKNDTAVIAKKAAEVQAWSKKATAKIIAVSKERQGKILGGMTSRLESITEQTKLLPPSAPVQQAITQGAQESKAAAQQGVQEVAKDNLLVKPLPRGDVF